MLAQSHARVHKERAMRRRQSKTLWKRLHQLQQMPLTRDALLLKLGAAKQQSPSAWRLVDIQVPTATVPLRFTLRKERLRAARRREGRYLLRTNLTDTDPATLWGFYLQLARVEEAFRTLKGDLALRPIYHQNAERIEAHIFLAFLAYCLQVTLAQRLTSQASGLTPRAVLDQLKAIQMLDVRVPTTDGAGRTWPGTRSPTRPSRCCWPNSACTSRRSRLRRLSCGKGPTPARVVKTFGSDRPSFQLLQALRPLELRKSG